MLRRLRNKILLLNTLLTFVVVVVAFAAIYLITNNNIQTENASKLEAIAGGQFTVGASETHTGSPTDAVAINIEEKRLSANYSLSFQIKVDPSGQVIDIDSLIDMPKEAYNQAAETAWNHKAGRRTIEINNKLWQYAITPATSTRIVNENGMQTIIASQDGSYHISFLDVTESMETLRTLAVTFTMVGFAVLAAIFLISLIFANRAIRPISEAWEKQRQFVADASHELKTPLAIINANYDVLLSNKQETISSQIKWLEYMKVGTNRMTNLINSLLSLARMENETIDIKKAPFNMSEQVSEIVQSMEAPLHEKGIALFQSIEPGIILDNDREIVAQVFTILYDNAIKYTEENGHIEVSLTQSDRLVTCTVKNSGKGIAPQDLPKIFDRFYRVDPSRTGETGGYGLGLSIAKSCIERLGGTITASSAANEMTSFSFTLPATRPAPFV
ncbi:two-component sensor histidine kinase [Paenibacillus sp. 598K]|uniref:sensor histidine kinase n=1 Tax=Paenibacillus sp. 598K TaxID=1117987 RepID=UPI000FF9AA4F|nr:HAMP domain-containing sensor histidine kinase [Paenibacillus sp. 598K]GBF75247.1 two-component sensor histidine kinase [Paenibacillus sp. 598K]